MVSLTRLRTQMLHLLMEFLRMRMKEEATSSSIDLKTSKKIAKLSARTQQRTSNPRTCEEGAVEVAVVADSGVTGATTAEATRGTSTKAVTTTEVEIEAVIAATIAEVMTITKTIAVAEVTKILEAVIVVVSGSGTTTTNIVGSQ